MQRRHVISLILVLSLACLAPKCGSNKVREASKASDRIATLIGSMIDLKRDLGVIGPQGGGISPAEELKLTEWLLKVNTATKQFTAKARTLSEDSPTTKLELASAFNSVTTAVNSLSNQAIFPIRNPEAKAKFLALLNSVNASIQIIDTALRS